MAIKKTIRIVLILSIISAGNGETVLCIERSIKLFF